MRFARLMPVLVIACLSSSAASRNSVYRNREYGIVLPIPQRARLCVGPHSGADHGAQILPGMQDVNLCASSTGKRWISIFAGYNAAEGTKTLHTFLDWECAKDVGGLRGQAPHNLKINGLSTEVARMNHPDGSITIIVIAQAGKPDPDFDALVPSINYDLSLYTDARHFDEDLAVFRAVLRTIQIAPKA